MKNLIIILVSSLLLLSMLSQHNALAQGVAINTNNSEAHSSAMLDVKSEVSGLLIPRMRQVSRDAIVAPATGLLIYQTDNNPGFYYWDGTTWVRLSIGTGDVDGSGAPTRVAFWSDNSTLSSNANLYWDNNNGRLGVGTSSPQSKLHIKDNNFGFLELDRTDGGFGSWIISPSNDFTSYSGKHAIRFRYNGSDKLSLTSDGDIATNGGAYFGDNVGIGTASPTEQLHVNGSAIISEDVLNFNRLKSGRHVYRQTVSYQATNSDQIWLLVENQGGNNEVIGTLYGQRSSAHWGAAKIDILVSTRNASGYTARGFIEVSQGLRDNDLWSLVTLDYNGNSYIGLRYQGQQYVFTELFFDGYIVSSQTDDILLSLPASEVSNIQLFDVSNTRKTVMADRFGLGTSNPSAQLHTTGTVRFQNYTNGMLRVNAIGELSVTDASGMINAGDGLSWSDNTLNSVWTESGDNIYNNNSGNVGIGSTNPLAKLHILAAENATDGTNGVFVQIQNINANSDNNRMTGIRFINNTAGSNPKAAIFFNRQNSWGRGDLHFAINNTANSTAVSRDDTHMIIKANGRVGIGTTAPGEKLHIDGTARIGGASGVSNYASPNTGGLFVDAEIRFGNATSSNDFINNVYQPMIYGTRSGGSGGFGSSSLIIQAGGTGSNRHIYIRTGNANRLFVHHNGNIGIGTITPSYKLHVIGRFKSDGINETSDIRLKKNIEKIENALDIILEMQGVSYEWNKEDMAEGKQIGLIAQEVEKILPEIVDTDNEGYKSIQYSVLVAVLIEALKDQEEKHNKLLINLQATNDRVHKLEQKFMQLKKGIVLNKIND